VEYSAANSMFQPLTLIMELKLDLTRELHSSTPAGTYEDSSRWGSVNLGSGAVNFFEETSYLSEIS
jgi:hypothetical protein